MKDKKHFSDDIINWLTLEELKIFCEAINVGIMAEECIVIDNERNIEYEQ